MKLTTAFPCLITALTFLSGAPVMAEAMDVLVSQRLNDLQHETETGNRGAVESFWRVIAEQGMPMVEPIEGDEDHVLDRRPGPSPADADAHPGSVRAGHRERGGASAVEVRCDWVGRGWCEPRPELATPPPRILGPTRGD